MKKPLIVLTGPTAVGKTEISIQLAKACGGEIISADSMQVYRHMDIGTAKIRPDQMQGIPHYMIDEWEPDEEFNAYLFQKRVKQYIEDIHSRGKIPLLVGGTGFYIQAVLYDIEFTDGQADDSYRNMLAKEAKEKGAGWLHKELEKIDAVSAAAIHENNVKRVIRALEYYHFTGEKFSLHNASQRKRKSPYSFLYVVLTMEREDLYRRIDRRVDRMMAEGLEREVDWLLKQGYDTSLVSMQGLGYKEIAAALKGECTMEEAVYRLKRDTRHFAKRQMTWFRREKEVTMLSKENFRTDEEIVENIVALAKEKGVLV
ncbi:MAG: tRNA (adenosine(37)-N6)-dimethylallyltransferase MiaA [Lachnospiraceae bacterium]|nr:tRNA (adenosine(37)-N6)-dimethylallyltransferase MiaA [Lachnospiraceae bacterium]